jgi:predicted nucleotidyltransferase
VPYLELINRITTQLDTEYLVVGAFARDLLLTEVLSASAGIYTEDIDLGIQLPDWSAYRAVATELGRNGYRRGKAPHEYVGPDGLRTDLLPYGPVESNRTISFAQTTHIALNMMGFQEAAREPVNFSLDDKVDFRTPSPAGVVLLKLIAWGDRFPRSVAGKHVMDIGLLLEALFDGNIDRADEDAAYTGAFDTIDPPTPLNHSALVIGRQIARLVAGDIQVMTTLRGIYVKIINDDQSTFVDQLSRPLVVRLEEARSAVDYMFAPFL